ncbi:hypothetical protein IJM86_00585 [bacterium]|nr:hypothetical protein [bacterium]
MKQEDELMCSKPLTDEVLSENLLPILQDHLTDYKTYKPEYKKRKKKILNNPEEYPYVHRFNQLLSLCPNRQTDSLYDINKAYTDENGDTILIQISLSDGGTIGYLRKKK